MHEDPSNAPARKRKIRSRRGILPFKVRAALKVAPFVPNPILRKLALYQMRRRLRRFRPKGSVFWIVAAAVVLLVVAGRPHKS